MLFSVVLFLFVFCIVNGFILLEEETLIILASIVWVDAAGGVIKSSLDSELVIKAEVIKKKFIWFLLNKKALLLDLQGLHNSRITFSEELNRLYLFFVPSLVSYSLVLFLGNTQLVNKFLVIQYLYNLSLIFYSDINVTIESQKKDLLMDFSQKTLIYKGNSSLNYSLGHLDCIFC